MNLNIAVPIKKFTFYPDKPKRTTVSCLERFEKNKQYCAVSKLDGYNAFVCNDNGNVEVYSRTWSTLPASDELKHAWSQFLGEKLIPNNSIINCEWMKFRAGAGDFKYDGPECLYMLTPYVLNGLFVGHLPYTQRREWMESLNVPIDNIAITKSSDIVYQVILPALTETNILSFYEAHKHIPRTEGVVIYQKKGIISINRNGPSKTHHMLKCKYREGDDGRTEI